MHQSNLYFSLSGKLFLQFKSDVGELDNSAITILRAYVPGLTQLELAPPHVDVILEHKEGKVVKLEQGENEVILYGPWGDELLADVYHLLYSMARLSFLKKNFYSVHGACVVSNGKGILILGHSGSGKTTVALKLAREYGMDVVSGNKTVMEFNGQTIRAIAGTTVMSVRKTDKEKEFIKDGLNYKDRYIFEFNQGKHAPLPLYIKAIVIVKLNDFSNESNKLKLPGSIHALYPYFFDVVNADVIVSRNVFAGVSPTGSQEFLVKNLEEVLTHVPVYSYTGSVSFIADNISKL